MSELLLEKLLDSSGTPAVPSKLREGSQLEQLLVFSWCPRKAALWAQEDRLAQSVQVFPGDLTPTFSRLMVRVFMRFSGSEMEKLG